MGWLDFPRRKPSINDDSHLENATNVFPPLEKTPSRRGAVYLLWRDLLGTRRLAKKNNLNMLASSVAFFCIFSLSPFLILCFIGSQYLLSRIGVRSSAADMTNFFGALFPDMDPSFAQNLNYVLHANALSNALSIALLCWSTYELFVCLHTVFAKISTKGSNRNFFFANLMSVICFLIVASACTLFLLISTTSPEALQTLVGQYQIAGMSLSIRMVRYMAYAVALTGVIFSITTIYKLMPTQKIKIRNAFRASLLFVGIFLAGRASYQLYVAFFKIMNENVYGALLHFLVILIWIYFLSSAFLFSAQYAIFLEEKN